MLWECCGNAVGMLWECCGNAVVCGHREGVPWHGGQMCGGFKQCDMELNSIHFDLFLQPLITSTDIYVHFILQYLPTRYT